MLPAGTSAVPTTTAPALLAERPPPSDSCTASTEHSTHATPPPSHRTSSSCSHHSVAVCTSPSQYTVFLYRSLQSPTSTSSSLYNSTASHCLLSLHTSTQATQTPCLQSLCAHCLLIPLYFCTLDELRPHCRCLHSLADSTNYYIFSIRIPTHFSTL